jgi:predicted ATP-dependent endonuclease of OLD family
MKISKFIIQKYRAIENVEVNVSNPINPIVGVNESGKTSVLKAILAFDKNRDGINQKEHLDFQNKYSTKPAKESRISALISLTKDEINDLIKATKVKTDSDQYLTVSEFNSKYDFLLTRVLLESSETKYVYENKNLLEETNKKVANYLVKHLPTLLYFDDFSDRVPDAVDFPEEYAKTGKLTRSKLRDWQEIIEEIFKRADTEGIEDAETPLQSYMNIADSDRKSDILNDIEQELNKEIIDEWKRIKKAHKSLADDSDKLTLSLINEGGKFQFKVRDNSYNDRRRTFNISERSKGFQWFFNYMIKLKFNPNYTKKKENSIFLLDEPGSYLHSSAQMELLKELQRVSKNNTIIYCTHSQYLLNPVIIQLGSIKIAEKEGAKVSLTDFGKHSSKKDKGALSPIYQALNLNFAHDFLGNIVITEGVTDYFLFKMLQDNKKEMSVDWHFIPSSGAGQSGTLISLALSYAEKFKLLLDNDGGGKEAKKKYLKEFGEHFEQFIFMYQVKKKSFELEDYLSKSDQTKLMSITNTDNLKRSIGFLFHDYKEHQEGFIKNLDENTLSNLEEVFELLR